MSIVLSAFVITFGLAAYPGGNLSAAWRWQFYAGAPRLGQAHGNGLPGRTGAVFSFANVVKFLADEFSRLGGGRFSFLFVFARPFNRSSFRHKILSAGPVPVDFCA